MGSSFRRAPGAPAAVVQALAGESPGEWPIGLQWGVVVVCLLLIALDAILWWWVGSVVLHASSLVGALALWGGCGAFALVALIDGLWIVLRAGRLLAHAWPSGASPSARRAQEP